MPKKALVCQRRLWYAKEGFGMLCLIFTITQFNCLSFTITQLLRRLTWFTCIIFVFG
jgi:hypothetical protein